VTPETLQQCLEFLRKYGEETEAHAACVIVSKQDISYPQVPFSETAPSSGTESHAELSGDLHLDAC
jgi:hypothetical protein